MEELTKAAVDFGGSNVFTGASTSRTLMLSELSTLLAVVPAGAATADYWTAIVDDNVLLKGSVATRKKTFSYLQDRFTLDPAVPIFRLLRLLWDRDAAGQPLMALLVAAFRDPVLRATMPVMIERQPDQAIPSREFARIVEGSFPGRFGEKTLKAAGERITASYRQSGHLRGRQNCTRARVEATPASATIALLLATLQGSGGTALLDTDWVRMLDSPGELILSAARVAAGRGWLEIRHAGDVLEISFHQLLAAIGGAG